MTSDRPVFLAAVLAVALAAVLAGAASCAPASAPSPAAPGPVDPAASPAFDDPPPLAGTAWRLVAIRSMDDRVFEPDDRDRYTLEFDAERVAVRADCNRGSGTWTREGRNDLRFGPLAMTKAMCPPGSLFDRFVRDLDAVRSFVYRDGNLHLATMADGAILELEPRRGEP